MNKLFTKIAGVALGLTMAIGVGVAVASNQEALRVDAGEEVFYTLTPASGSNNGYANNCDIAIGGITWNLTGNSTMQPWRIGGKNLTGVDRALYSKTKMESTITKVEMTIGTANDVTINSSSFIIATDSNFSNIVETKSLGTSIVSKTTTIQPSTGKTWKDCYYKFVFNVTIGGSNKYIQFTEAKFYYDAPDPDKSLSSITLSGTYPTSFTVNDEFSHTGMTVTANFDDESTDDVTSSASWSGYNMSETGNQTVTVSYTFSGTTKTATYSISVNAFSGDYNKLTDSSQIHDGMIMTFGNYAKQAVATSFGTYIEAAQNSATIMDNGLKGKGSVLEFTVKGKVNEWMLLDSEGNWLSQTAASKNNLALNKTGSNKYWTITIADGVATISNNGGDDYGALYFNSSSPRISNYQSKGTMALPEIYVKESTDNVLTFIRNNMRMGDTSLVSENDTGNCKASGNGYYITAKTALHDLTSSERTDFENDANSKYTEALRRYNAWASACRDAHPFDGGTTISQANLVNSIITENNGMISIIIVISMIGVTSVGGFFFLRKRKEQ